MYQLILFLSNITSNNVIDSAADNDGVIILPTEPIEISPKTGLIISGIAILIFIAFIFFCSKHKSQKKQNRENN